MLKFPRICAQFFRYRLHQIAQHSALSNMPKVRKLDWDMFAVWLSVHQEDTTQDLFLAPWKWGWHESGLKRQSTGLGAISLYIFGVSQISFLDYPRWTIPTKFHHFPSFPSCSIIFHHFHHVRSFLHLLGSWIFHHFPSFSNIFQHVPKSSKIPALDPYPNWYKLVHGWESHSPGDSAAGLWVRSDRQRFPGPWEVPKMALTRII